MLSSSSSRIGFGAGGGTGRFRAGRRTGGCGARAAAAGAAGTVKLLPHFVHRSVRPARWSPAVWLTPQPGHGNLIGIVHFSKRI
jgi:hypothetical protein